MSPRRWRWTNVMRGLILAVLAGLVTVVVWLVVDRLIHKPQIINTPPDKIASIKVEVQEQGTFVEFRGDQSKIEAKFDRHSKDAAGLDHLEGHVLIIDYGKTGGRELRMAGDAATYDKDWTHIHVQGNATVQIEGLTIVSTEFDYDKTSDSIGTSAGAQIVSPRVTGKCRRVSYALGADEITFEDDLDFTLIPRDPGQKSVQVKARRFRYNQKERRGRIEDQVSFVRGPTSGRAGTILFELFPTNDNLSRVEFQGGVELSIEEPPKTAAAPASLPKATGFTDFISFEAERRRITAQSVILIFFENTTRLNAFLVRGQSAVKLLSAGGNTTDLVAETIDFIYLPEGELRDFTMEGSPRIIGFQAASKQTKSLEGVKIFYEDRELRIDGGADRPATFVEPDRSLTGGLMKLYFRLNSFDAADRVAIVSTPRERGRGTSGFFTQDLPVFIRADSIRYDDQARSFWMSGRVRMWQGRESLLVEEMRISEETGEMHGQGGVKSVFTHTPKAKAKAQEERVEIEAATLDYDPAAQKILYGGTGTLRMKDVSVKASSVTVELAQGEIQRVVASQNVTVLQGMREATGELAVYDAAAEIIVLTGRPTLKEKGKGSVTGEKLTFHLADGKIVVENRDGETQPPPSGPS